MYGFIVIQICAVGSKNASFLHLIAFWPFKVVQAHPRSMILVPIESAYTTSY